MGDEEPFLYDSTGTFVARLGRVGDGPGEFRRPAAVLAGRGDTLHVFDGRTARVALFLSRQFVGTVQPMPRTYTAALLSDGSYLINNSSAGFPLQIWNEFGEMLTEFGSAESVRGTDAMFRNLRAITVTEDETIWTVTKSFDYVIQSWDSGGRLISEHRPDRPWFQPYDSMTFSTPDSPPDPSINDIWRDGEGLLWIFGRVAASSWADGLTQDNQFERGVYQLDSPQRVFDLQIDVFDPTSNEVLASRRIPGIGALGTIVAPGLLATRRTDEDGWWFADIWKLDLVTQSDTT